MSLIFGRFLNPVEMLSIVATMWIHSTQDSCGAASVHLCNQLREARQEALINVSALMPSTMRKALIAKAERQDDDVWPQLCHLVSIKLQAALGVDALYSSVHEAVAVATVQDLAEHLGPATKAPSLVSSCH
jgi:post-segregation antitoxin (ccd killing protein)